MFYNTALYPGVVPSGATADTGPCTTAGKKVTLSCGALIYHELESGYNVQEWINGNGGQVPSVVQHANYGQPYLYQLGRSIRFNLRYTF